MNFANGKLYIQKLRAGETEADIVQAFGIDFTELYATIAYVDQAFASEHLKDFCGGCVHDLCFCWPMRDETPCPARGYEPKCPLKKSK